MKSKKWFDNMPNIHEQNPRNLGEAILLRLKQLNVDFFFANPGTEFLSVIRGFHELPKAKVPEPVLAPHEFLAVSMAYGVYLRTQRPQVVMTHATVGAANALIGLIGAFRMNIPIIFIAGMTSAKESGEKGYRDKAIHWAQESPDQASIFRQLVKWEFEIREEACIYDILDRAYAISMSEPRGPVALSLSRDLLLSERVDPLPSKIGLRAIEPFTPSLSDLIEIKRMLENSLRPIIVTNLSGISSDLVRLLVEVSELHAIGVLTPHDFYVSFPADHPHHLGYKSSVVLSEADLVLVLDTELPWYPLREGPHKCARVIHLGPDPLCESMGLRSHWGDKFVRTNVKHFLIHLKSMSTGGGIKEHRQNWLKAMKEKLHSNADDPAGVKYKIVSNEDDEPPRLLFDPDLVAKVISEFIDENTVLINELSLNPSVLKCHHLGSYYRSGSTSSLGWGVGCALGIAESDRNKRIMVCVGDGVFYLSPLVGALLLAVERKSPFLLIVMNNSGLSSIATAAKDFYSLKTSFLPLTHFRAEGIRLDKIASAFGGWGDRVETEGELRAAITKGFDFIKSNRLPVIIEVQMDSHLYPGQ